MAETEKFTVSGSQIVEKVKQLIHEGNIRRVRLVHEGKTIIEIPLSIGAPAAVAGLKTSAKRPEVPLTCLPPM